jgi:hypothetical protein
MVFIIASLIFVSAVIVGVNVWAVRDTPLKGSEKLLREIYELLENEARRA